MSEVDSLSLPSTSPRNRELTKEQDDEINLVELLWVVVRNRWRIARAMLIAGFLVACITLLMKNVYESKVTLLPVADSDAGGLFGAAAGKLGAFGSLLPFGGRGATDPFQALLGSSALKERLIDEFDLEGDYYPDRWDFDAHQWIDPDPGENPTRSSIIGKLAKRFSVSTDSDTGLVTVAIQDNDPELASRMANRVPELMEEMLTGMTLTTSKRQRVFIERQADIVEKKLRDLQERLVNFSAVSGGPSGANDPASPMSGLATATVSIGEDTVRWLTGASDVLKQISAVEMEIALKESQGVPVGGELLQQREALRSQLDAINRQAGDSSPNQALTSVPVSRIPVIAMEYLHLSQELYIQQELYKLLRQQLEMSRIGEIKESVAFQLVDPAIPSDLRDKVGPKRALIVLASMLVVGFMAVVIAFVREGGRNVDAETEEILARIRRDLSLKVIADEAVPGLLGRLPEEKIGSGLPNP